MPLDKHPVKYVYCSYEEYQALTPPDTDTLYYVPDVDGKNAIFVGSVRFGEDLYDIATPTTSGLMSGADKSKLNSTNIAYGTCSTSASTAAKIVNISGTESFAAVPGTIIGVKFSNTNTANNPTLNVGSTGAKPIYYNTSTVTTSNLTAAGQANRITYYMYDGNNWSFLSHSLDNDTIYTLPPATPTTLGGVAIDTQRVILPSDGWGSGGDCEITLQNYRPNDIFIVSYDPMDRDNYLECGVYCYQQETNNLRFRCDTIPEYDIPVNIVILSTLE